MPRRLWPLHRSRYPGLRTHNRAWYLRHRGVHGTRTHFIVGGTRRRNAACATGSSAMRHLCLWVHRVRGKIHPYRERQAADQTCTQMYTGGPPFYGNNPTVRSQMLLSGSRPQRPGEARVQSLGLDDDMWMFIQSLWAHRPEARLVAESARDFLRYRASATGLDTTRDRDDPEWDTGFLSALAMADDLFSL